MNQPSVSVAGNLRISTAFNEPARDYRPVSPEATALLAEIDRARGQVRDLPNVIDGDSTSEYALTCSTFANDRAAIETALDRLRDTAGMTYVNDKPTGALIGRQAFGGGEGSGTNDKVGSPQALQRWVNARFVKENFAPAQDWTYPYMGGS